VVSDSHLNITRSVTDYVLQFDGPLSGSFSGASVLRKGQTLSYANTFNYKTDSDCVVNFWGRFVATAVNGTFYNVGFQDLQCTACSSDSRINAARRRYTEKWHPKILNSTDCQNIAGTNLQWIRWEHDDCEAFTTNENILFGFNTTSCSKPEFDFDGPSGADSLLSTGLGNSAGSLKIASAAIALVAALAFAF